MKVSPMFWQISSLCPVRDSRLVLHGGSQTCSPMDGGKMTAVLEDVILRNMHSWVVHLPNNR